MPRSRKDLRCDIGSADRHDGIVELRMCGIAKPVGLASDVREILALLLELVAWSCQGHAKLALVAGKPLLLQIGLGELRRRACYAKTLLHQRMAEVPGVLQNESGLGRKNLPGGRGGRTKPRCGGRCF